jgi:hypothetical protein
MSTDVAAVVIKNTPPAAVVGASFLEWFQALPISELLQWVTLVWVLIQAGGYIYDRVKARKERDNGCKK